jgi:ATP-binding cassette subfamily B protein
MPQRTAVARAWSFLNFKPVAKWSALAAAVGTALFYVVLLIVLLLFVDLMVHGGHIATHADLAPAERDGLGLPTTLTPADQEKEWRAHVAHLLDERVGGSAADLYRERTAAQSGNAGRPYFGILGTVVSTRDHWLLHRSVAVLARWSPWMWDTDDALPYMSGLLLIAVGVAMVRALLLFTADYCAALATIEASTRLRRAVYHHAFRLGTLAARAQGPSEAVGMFTRHVDEVHDMLSGLLTVVLREPVKFLLVINFWLALAFLVVAVLVWLIGQQLAAFYQAQARKTTKAAERQLSLLQESLMLIRLVKCYLMELFNQSRVERQLKVHAQALRQRSRAEAIYRPLLGLLAVLAAVILLYFAGLIVLDGRLEVVAGIVLAAALASLYWPAANVMEQLPVLRRGREAAQLLFRFLDRPGEVSQTVGAEFLPPLSQMLELDDVTLREPGAGRMLLRGATLSIQAGQRVALVGPDDAEKHALIYLIPRLLDPTSGEIRIDQHNLRWVTLDSLRAQVAVVLQHNLIFNDTVLNNIGCGDQAYTMPQIIEAAKVAHAHQFIQKLPQGYDTPIGESGHTLNVGEQFRVALARAILRDPALIVIEEPAGTALDDDTKSLLDDTFARMVPGRTAIFLPHRLSTIRLCNQVLLLHKGKIEAAGEHRELLTKSELYQHLHYLEFNVFAGRT